MANDFDVIIVGAGPGGSSCALALRHSGLKVALIDKKSFPRNKTCGDAIPGPSLKILKALVPEVDMDQFEQKQSITDCSIYTPNNNAIHISWEAEAYNCKRIDFDDYLLNLVRKYSNTEVMEALNVTDVRLSDKIEVTLGQQTTQLSASIIIGCDGANSAVAKSFDITTQNKTKNMYAVRAYYSEVDCDTHKNEFFLLPKSQGYFWIFPLGNNLFNVGLGLMQRHDAAVKVNLKATFQECISQDSVIRKRFLAASLISNIDGFRLPYGGVHNQISGERFMLVGDAAKLIDPLQGHGIDKAMNSGMLAGKQAMLCVKKNNFSAQFISQYDQSVYRTYGKELRYNLLAMKLLYQFPFLSNWFAKLSSNANFMKIIKRIF